MGCGGVVGRHDNDVSHRDHPVSLPEDSARSSQIGRLSSEAFLPGFPSTPCEHVGLVDPRRRHRLDR
jgi:hypothetical protein